GDAKRRTILAATGRGAGAATGYEEDGRIGAAHGPLSARGTGADGQAVGGSGTADPVDREADRSRVCGGSAGDAADDSGSAGELQGGRRSRISPGDAVSDGRLDVQQRRLGWARRDASDHVADGDSG